MPRCAACGQDNPEGFRFCGARTTSGAGLGLAIARGLVEAHGGTVAVANLNGGCRFTVRLPTRTGAGTLTQGG